MENLQPHELFFPRLDHLEQFTVPTHDKKEEMKLFSDFINLVPTERPPFAPYDNVMVIGRYQPLHYGHLYLMKQALNIAENLTIGIGSANVRDTDNPFSPEEREYMIRKAIKKNGIGDRVLKIVYLDDNPDDDMWFEKIKEKVPYVQAVVGNNDWVNGIFQGKDLDAWNVPYLSRGSYEGKKIRAYLRSVNKL
jgi:nicotinamide-nucleotide adenylyltransferase